jgi:sodium/hydrogen antiporter
VLQVPEFVVFGAALPWPNWIAMGWRAPVPIGTILLLRRIPAVLLLQLWLTDLRSRQEALFVGWFGPIGVGALFFAIVAHEETGIGEVWTVRSLRIAATIVVQGLTITPLRHRLNA